MIGLIIHDHLGIGDKLQFSHVPENLFNLTGEKVVDLNKCWIYDFNPYVLRNCDDSVSEIIDLWAFSHKLGADNFLSIPDRFFRYFKDGDYKPKLRHNRLYKFEDEPLIPNRITVHTTGVSQKVNLTDEIINQIQKQYFNYEIIQIGGPHDKKTPFISKLGLPMWETVELIAKSSIFIGVNSGMFNIANCFPRINKKIFLNCDLTNFRPLISDGWIDYGLQYYNFTKDDIGITNSYLKI